MDLFLNIIAEGILNLLGKAVRHTKSARTQLLIDVLVASIFLVGVDGYTIWKAVSCYRQGNVPMAVAFAAVAVISILLVGFVAFRRLIRKKKAEESKD